MGMGIELFSIREWEWELIHFLGNEWEWELIHFFGQ